MGLDGGRLGVIVDFARPGAAFTWDLWPGNVLDAEVARFPGSVALRVLVSTRRADPAPYGAPPGWADLGQVMQARGSALASDPWLERWPVSVADVVPLRTPSGWELADRDGRRLTLSTEEATGWRLLAVSGGRPVKLFGEWQEEGLVPLSVRAHERMVVL
jgi:hypothetical protein